VPGESFGAITFFLFSQRSTTPTFPSDTNTAVRRHRGHFSRCNLKELPPPSWASTSTVRGPTASQQQPGPPRRMAVLIYDAASRPLLPRTESLGRARPGWYGPSISCPRWPNKARCISPQTISPHHTTPHHTTINDHKRGLSVPGCENNCSHSTAASPTSLARHSARRSPPGAPDSAC
jgi:hypothetical protein